MKTTISGVNLKQKSLGHIASDGQKDHVRGQPDSDDDTTLMSRNQASLLNIRSDAVVPLSVRRNLRKAR